MPKTVDVPEYEVRKRVTLDPAVAALAIIETQDDFVRDEGTLQVAGAPATILAISRLLGLARDSGMRVAFSRDTLRQTSWPFPGKITTASGSVARKRRATVAAAAR